MKKTLTLITIIGALAAPVHAAYTIDGMISQDWGVDLSAASSKGYLDTHRPSGATVDVATEDNTDAATPFTQVFPGTATITTSMPRRFTSTTTARTRTWRSSAACRPPVP